MTAALLQIVKSVREQRRVSVYRDARFMRDLQRIYARKCAGSLPLALVSRDLSLTYPLHLSIFDRASRREPWWRNLNGGEPHPKPARQFRTPAEWRDVSDTLHVHYLHLGLMALGPVHYFSLRLGSPVEAQASSAPTPWVGWPHASHGAYSSTWAIR